jgi:hypothetical protein
VKRRPPKLPPWFVRECYWRMPLAGGIRVKAGDDSLSEEAAGEIVGAALDWWAEHGDEFEAWRHRIHSGCRCNLCLAGGSA